MAMRRMFVAAFTAVVVVVPVAAAAANPIIQPLRCRIGDMTGVYVGGKCSGPYQP